GRNSAGRGRRQGARRRARRGSHRSAAGHGVRTMSRPLAARLLHMLALAAGLPVLASSLGCDENVLDPMADRQPRAHPYKESVFFADGLSMRAPPEGTVPRERITGNPVLTTGREGETGQIAANGERVPSYAKAIPLPVTRKLLDLGRKRFNITCATCHGPA